MASRLLFVLALCFAAGVSSQNFEAETGNFVIKVTGNQNVPRYSYWHASSPQDVYSISFSKLYEATSENDEYVATKDQIAMASLSYEFSTPVTETIEYSVPPQSEVVKCVQLFSVEQCRDFFEGRDCGQGVNLPRTNCACGLEDCLDGDDRCDSDAAGEFRRVSCLCECGEPTVKEVNVTSFNISNFGDERGSKQKTWWSELTFVNKLVNEDDNQELKIDTVIKGYEFQTEGAKLIFDLSASFPEGGSIGHDDETYFTSGDAFVRSAKTALTTGGEEVGVRLIGGAGEEDMGEDKATLKLVFDNFKDDLVHDPMIGFASDGPAYVFITETNPSGLEWYWGLVIGVCCFCAGLLAGLALFMFKKRTYEQV